MGGIEAGRDMVDLGEIGGRDEAGSLWIQTRCSDARSFAIEPRHVKLPQEAPFAEELVATYDC